MKGGKKKMEYTLCCTGNCPKVINKEDFVEIGEKDNLVQLKKEEWNMLVESIQKGKLKKI